MNALRVLWVPISSILESDWTTLRVAFPHRIEKMAKAITYSALSILVLCVLAYVLHDYFEYARFLHLAALLPAFYCLWVIFSSSMILYGLFAASRKFAEVVLTQVAATLEGLGKSPEEIETAVARAKEEFQAAISKEPGEWGDVALTALKEGLILIEWPPGAMTKVLIGLAGKVEQTTAVLQNLEAAGKNFVDKKFLPAAQFFVRIFRGLTVTMFVNTVLPPWINPWAEAVALLGVMLYGLSAFISKSEKEQPLFTFDAKINAWVAIIALGGAVILFTYRISPITVGQFPGEIYLQTAIAFGLLVGLVLWGLLQYTSPGKVVGITVCMFGLFGLMAPDRWNFWLGSALQAGEVRTSYRQVRKACVFMYPVDEKGAYIKFTPDMYMPDHKYAFRPRHPGQTPNPEDILEVNDLVLPIKEVLDKNGIKFLLVRRVQSSDGAMLPEQNGQIGLIPEGNLFREAVLVGTYHNYQRPFDGTETKGGFPGNQPMGFNQALTAVFPRQVGVELLFQDCDGFEPVSGLLADPVAKPVVYSTINTPELQSRPMLAANLGTEPDNMGLAYVRAAAAGKVVGMTLDNRYYASVTIEHDFSAKVSTSGIMWTHYGLMNNFRFGLELGDTVAPGDTLGTISIARIQWYEWPILRFALLRQYITDKGDKVVMFQDPLRYMAGQLDKPMLVAGKYQHYPRRLKPDSGGSYRLEPQFLVSSLPYILQPGYKAVISIDPAGYYYPEHMYASALNVRTYAWGTRLFPYDMDLAILADPDMPFACVWVGVEGRPLAAFKQGQDTVSITADEDTSGRLCIGWNKVAAYKNGGIKDGAENSTGPGIKIMSVRIYGADGSLLASKI